MAFWDIFRKTPRNETRIPTAEEYVDLLNGRELDALLDLARGRLTSDSDDELAWLMVAHAMIRRGRFSDAIASLNELKRSAPEKSSLAHDLASMCAREVEVTAATTQPQERERLHEFDPWRDEDATEPVRGKAQLDDGSMLEFSDLRDMDPTVGRRLVTFLLDRTLQVPFRAISTITLSPRSAIHFDDVWPPISVVLRDGEPFREVHCRAPVFYPSSLSHPEPLVASGRQTHFVDADGIPSALGQRDFAFNTGGGETLVGILNLAAVTFDDR